jgi:gas vesicle protein
MMLAYAPMIYLPGCFIGAVVGSILAAMYDADRNGNL